MAAALKLAPLPQAATAACTERPDPMRTPSLRRRTLTPTHRGLRPTLLAALAATLLASPAMAQRPVETIVISGNGTERRAFDAPFAVTVINADALRDAGPMVNLSEALTLVPGLVANARNNYAQDLQLSSRGYGARASFGIRGLRLYSDGIPATMPDGQGQVAHFDLAGAQRVEVLRGPFSALYGSSSGGVLSVVSAPPTQRRWSLDLDAGADGFRQQRLVAEAPLAAGWHVRALASGLRTAGPRPHSAAERTLANVRLGRSTEADTLTLVLNHAEQPAQDPLGLTRAQFEADPQQTATQAPQFNTRKSARQTQAGASWRHRFSGDGALRELQAAAYAGRRAVTQWQAIPVATQAAPAHPGGVIDFERDYGGADLRAVWRWAGGTQLVAGLNVEQQDEDRRGYENFIGTTLGVSGALRRQESSRLRNTDVYAQAEQPLGAGFTATAGLRHGRLQLSTQDAYLRNGDDSGSQRLHYTNPVAALQWAPAGGGWNLYVSAGRGFETPTLGELAYRPDGAPGLNSALRAQSSRQVEMGTKWRAPALNLQAELALFDARTNDEIGVLTNAGGRSAFQNVGRTQRRGAELAVRWQPHPAWRVQAAATTLSARYLDAFTACTGVPCTTTQGRVTVAPGGRIAGTQPRSAALQLAWAPPGTGREIGLELRQQGAVAVNDRNTDFAPSATTAALRASQALQLGAGTLTLRARVDNLSGRPYVGSVIVGDANGRFFEPVTGRAWLLQAQWQQPF